MHDELMRRAHEAATEAADALDDFVLNVEKMLTAKLGDPAAAKMAMFKTLEACITLHIWRNVRQDAYTPVVRAMSEMIRETLDATAAMESRINSLTPPDRRPT